MEPLLSGAKGIFLALVNFLPLLKNKNSLSSSSFSLFVQGRERGSVFFALCVCVLIFTFFNPDANCPDGNFFSVTFLGYSSLDI